MDAAPCTSSSGLAAVCSCLPIVVSAPSTCDDSPAASVPGPGPLAGLDPGRSKCGLVLTDASRCFVVEALVLSPEASWERLQLWQRRPGLAAVVVGNGTGSGSWCQRLGSLLPLITVEEWGSTLAARERFWQLEQPRGWRRLLPVGLRQPPRDWDDVVAQLLLERWLGRPLQRDQKLERTVKA